MLNSCKESVTVDLKHPDGVALFKRLVAKADVVLVNYAPGVPERLGIGFEQQVLFIAFGPLVVAIDGVLE